MQPTYDLPTLTSSYQWNSLDKKISKLTKENEVFYCVKSSDKQSTIDTQQCKEYFWKQTAFDFDDYNDYIKKTRSIRVMSINDDNPKLSTCSCWFWCKHYKCKHVIGALKRLDLLEYPLKAKQIAIGMNRPCGRPKEGKAKGALIFEKYDDDKEYQYSDSENEEVVQPKALAKRGRKRKEKEVSSDESEDDFQLLREKTTSTAANKRQRKK